MAEVPATPATRPAPVAPATGPVSLLVLAAAAAAGAAWLILEGRSRPAGVLALAGGTLLLAGGPAARRRDDPLVRFLASAVDRAFDGLLLAALAWALVDTDPRPAALAIVALGTSFFAAYARARGSTLGYPVEESVLNRALRYAILSAGLLTTWVEASLWVLAVFTSLTAAVRVSQVAKGERAS
jgi:phosphatidylglycerophosphate synthase